MTTEAKHMPRGWRAAHFLGEADLLVDGDRVAKDRVYACVRACAGIPTEQLSDWACERLLTAAEDVAAELGSYVEGADYDSMVRLKAALVPFQKDIKS